MIVVRAPNGWKDVSGFLVDVTIHTGRGCRLYKRSVCFDMGANRVAMFYRRLLCWYDILGGVIRLKYV